MSMSRTVEPLPPIEAVSFRRIVWSLAVAQTLVWAALFYSFPALLLVWERELGWSKAELSGALTVALIVSGLLAPVVGRVIDRGYGSQILIGSALLGAACLVALSAVAVIWQFYVVYLVLGAAMAGTLYEACFAFLTKTMQTHSKQAIIVVTLVAGFAGTISFPGNNALEGLVGWRGTMLVLAAIITFMAVPLMWFGCRTASALTIPSYVSADMPRTETVNIVRNLTFWLLALSFVSVAVNHGVLLTHLLPLLDERGISDGVAVLAASMIGPMQVVGRLMMLAVEKRISSLTVFVTCFVAMGLASLSLLGANHWPLLLVSFVLLQGAGYGTTSILRPVVTANLLGYRNYGLIAGLLAVPFQAAAAAAPTLAALIWEIGGYDWVIWFAGGTAVVGLITLLIAATMSRDR